jgi:hypothetical protein
LGNSVPFFEPLPLPPSQPLKPAAPPHTRTRVKKLVRASCGPRQGFCSPHIPLT